MSDPLSTPTPDRNELDSATLDQLFRQARTYNAFSGEVSDETLHVLYDLVKFGPTTANTCPARFVFVRSAEAKAKLGPTLDAGNHAKTMAAPVTVIVAYDLAFYEKTPVLFPHTDAKPWFDGKSEADLTTIALRNSSLQGAYLLLAARARAGLRTDVGLRQCPARRGVLRRHPDPFEFPGQPGPGRSGQHFPALAAAGLRGSLPHRVTLSHLGTPFRTMRKHA
jgi:hypothetical protein